jgi:Spy/CpxP family protein refolding chaperone
MMLMPRSFSHFFAGLAASAVLSIGIAHAATPPAEHDQMRQEWARHGQEMMKHRLAKMAERLEIKASQQNAWQAYVSIFDGMMSTNLKRPDASADAAAVTRFRADMAAQHAKKLAQIADATARLQEVLTPDQRKTLNDMMHQSHHRGHWGGHGPHGRDDNHGEHGGEGH